MAMMIKCGLLFIIIFLIAWAVTAQEITTENLLPNGNSTASSYQNIDNTIPKVNSNGFNVNGGIRDWGQELEIDGSGSINYTGDLTDYATQQQLDNGITLDGTTIVQNCEWLGSQYQCGNAQSGQDTYTTTIKILDDEGNTLAIVNQTRNTDAGYGNNAFKYEDSVTYNGVGSNQFYWEWSGVDLGSTGSLGGANLLGAKLTMTYNDEVLPPEVIENIDEVIEEFVEWETTFEEPEFIEVVPMALVFEELIPTLFQEEEYLEATETFEELQEEFEEVEILQVFEENVNETEVSEQKNQEANAGEQLQEESISEETSNESEQTESTTVATDGEQLEGEQPQEASLGLVAQDIQKQISETIKDVDKQLAVTNIIVADVMEKSQVNLKQYYKQMIDNRDIYNNQEYKDKLDLSIYNKEIYPDNKLVQVAQNDPLYKYQEQIRQSTYKRVILERELKQLRGY